MKALEILPGDRVRQKFYELWKMYSNPANNKEPVTMMFNGARITISNDKGDDKDEISK